MRWTARGELGATRRTDHHPGVSVHILGWLGIVLLVLWVVLWLGFKIVSAVVHLLVLIGVVLLIWGLVKKGARAVGNRR